MIDARSTLGTLALVVLVALAFVIFSGREADSSGARAGSGDGGARYGLESGGGSEAAPALPPAAPLRFAETIAPSDQQIVRQVVAEARPAARKLIDAVAGLVTIGLGAVGPGVAGRTTPTSGGYDVVLDLGTTYGRLGMRGVRRLVLHELAHVVDHALVPLDLEAQLDAGTPAGFGCEGGHSGGCAARAERFAESFAKWATGDVGNDLYLGYRVPPPVSLSGWGDPLAGVLR